jgi:hypothetical protein
MASDDPLGRLGFPGFLLVGDDAAAEPLRDLGDEAVSEGSKSVHPSGNPMSHSTHVGFNEPPTCVRRFSPPCRPELPGPPVPSLFVGVAQCATVPRFGDFRLPCDGPVSFQSRLLGVGNKPDPVAPVRGADGASRDAIPLRVIPARGQVPENSSEPSAAVASKEVANVLHDDVAGSKNVNESNVLAPKTRAPPVDPGLPSGDGEVLAGEAAAEDVDV